MSVTANKPDQELNNPVSALSGVGAERTALLKNLGIQTIGDLLGHRPHRYEDRRKVRPIRELVPGEKAMARGTITALGTKYFARRTKCIFEIVLEDGTGRLHCQWWNLPYMEKYFARGEEVFAFGKVGLKKPCAMSHPETELIEAGGDASIHIGSITPVYPLTEGLAQRWLRGLVWRTLATLEAQVQDPWPLELLPQGPGTSLFDAWPTRAQALRMIHFPTELSQPDLARKRLALDEYVELQSGLVLRRHRLETKAQAFPCGGDNRLIKPFLRKLPYKLTDGQTQVLKEIRSDMGGAVPMRRLLQGDVGCGKTAVAACAVLMAVESGFEAALMAPTEVLAEQHFRNLTAWFEPLSVAVELLTGSVKPPARKTGAKQSRLVIGTHALMHGGYAPENLGLLIIDEQHKFGVAQRERVLRKGNYPHLLVMTATPIPRTLGLTIYGDLDISTISQMPPGRQPIRTFVRPENKIPEVLEFIRGIVAQGRQGYVVCPQIGDQTETEVKAVLSVYERLKAAFAPAAIGLLHGRMDRLEKDSVMDSFRSRRTQVLVSTSVIEVGVDVPNATAMLILNAERFGLAQLHQLRGRVGRGAHPGFCILVTGSEGEESRQRLGVLEQTSDGFQIAEADLKIRGTGELLGQAQSGAPVFRFGELENDLELVRFARQIATKLAAREPAKSARNRGASSPSP